MYTVTLSGSTCVIQPYILFSGVGACVPESLVHQLRKGHNMIVTAADIEAAKTVKGGYSHGQARLGQLWTRRDSWKSALVGMNIPDEQWGQFVTLGKRKSKRIKSKQAKAKQIVNAMSKPDGWEWKPESKDMPAAKFKGKLSKNRGKNKAKRKAVSKSADTEFYWSREWRTLRARVIACYKRMCMMCGRNPVDDGIKIHVDHIKPRSKYPELSLDFNNLQLLCEDCNMGKGNKDETDWRPKGIVEKLNHDVVEQLDAQHLEAIKHLI